MEVKFTKLVENAVTPVYAKSGDAGMDFVAISVEYDKMTITYRTGIAIEIPYGYVGLLFPRSSITKCDPGVMLKNSVGVIDSGYRGEIVFKMEYPAGFSRSEAERIGFDKYITAYEINIPKMGDRVGQLIIMPYPIIKLIEVDKLNDSERGSDGFGSTGK